MKKPFTPSKSYTCVREFIIAYPNKEKPEFEDDESEKGADVVKKEGKDFKVVAESGRPMGTYPTQEAAKRRLAQIEMFKAMKAKDNA